MTDLTFTADEQPKMSAFNQRFSKLNELYQHWWKRSSLNGYTISVGTVSRVTVGEGGMDGVSSIQYSSSVSVSSSGTITLDNPVSASINENVLNQLKGKYFSGYNLTGIYYATTSAGTSVTGGSPLYYNIDCGKVTAEKSGETEVIYLQSSDRNAYPDSGIQGDYEYQYLGVPFDNAVEASKVVTGSYVGAGVYGSSNPNTLTFDFTPKLVCVTGGTYSTNEISLLITSATKPFNLFNGAAVSNLTSAIGQTTTWYSTGNANVQANTSGTQYTYWAID